MSNKSTGFYVFQAVAGLATLLIGGAGAKKGMVRDVKGFNDSMKAGAKNLSDGVKGAYNNEKNKK